MSVADRSFYVYEHWRPDTGLPFYVGKGKKSRAYLIDRPSKKRQKVLANLLAQGLSAEVRIVFSNLDEKTAFDLEKAQVSYWRQRKIPLVNLTQGGDGTTSGYKFTAEQKVAQSKIVKESWQNPEIKAKQVAAIRAAMKSPEVRALRRASAKALWATAEFREKMVASQLKAQSNPETRQKNSATQKVAQNRTGASAMMSARITEVWKRPEFRAAMAASKKRLSNSIKVKKENLRAANADVAFR